MALPLLLMALLWNRFDLGHRRWLRGREVSLGSLRFHTTSLISGFMFILIGILFIVYEGTSALEGFYLANGATDLAFSAQQWANGLARRTPIALVLAVLAAVVALILYRRGRKDRKKTANW
jgi:preprotein translocase subunit SecG